MKKYLLFMEDSLAASCKIWNTLFSFTDHKHQPIYLPTNSTLENKNSMKNKNNFMRNITGSLNKTYLLVIAAMLFTAVTVSAQIINEGFEETAWSNIGTGPGGNTFGSVSLPNIPANSVMSYLTSSTSFTTATNTCNNSGSWYFSKATTQSSSKYGAGAHSISHSIKLSQAGYIISPFTPAAVINITFWASNSSGAMVAGLATDPNAAGPGYNTSTSSALGQYTYATSTYAQGNGTMQSYSFGGTFSGPCRFGIFNPGGTIYVDDIMIYAPTGTPPTVATGTATAAITSATVSGTVTPGTLPLLTSGIIWSTTPLTGTVSDTLKPKTRDIPAATSTYTDAAGPLLPGTTYYAEAYVIGLDGSFYAGATIQFTTNSTSAPIVNTVPPGVGAVSSNKATIGGVIVDSGGLTITFRGIYYGLSKATLSNNIPSTAITSNFTLMLKGLQPLTKYYYQAYATNSKGTSVGIIDSFITSAPVPTLTAIPGLVDFGDIIYNTAAPVLSYSLSGDNLNPATGSITVNISPAKGFIISTSVAGMPVAPVSSITIPYTNGKFKKTVYIKLLTNSYGTFTSSIGHSGGGVAVADADSVNVTGNIIPSPDQLSNMGTDFWVGYGYEQNMKTDANSKTPVPYQLITYIATGAQPAKITVSIPGMPTAWPPVSYTIPANSVQAVTDFPLGNMADATNTAGMPDTRLYYTGVSNRGIHITSDNGVPVAVFIYDYATNNSAGGSMVFPTNTWNSSYIVQSYGDQKSNTGPPTSYFFVIASEDNTVVSFKPTKNIIDSASSPVLFGNNGGSTVKYAAGTTYTVTLNKGQIFNAMGDASTGIGYDLSGTLVSTDCSKKIAVFAGNGRVLITTLNSPVPACQTPTQGSDNLIQQMFPKVAWGTYYLTVPTKTMEYNVFRITVSDQTTQVWVNKPAALHNAANKLTANWNPTGMYYEVEGNDLKKIESDKPINVTQFITMGDCQSASIGNNGSGDPEMIILSPVKQAIKSATVYTPDFKHGASGGGDYINVIIPKNGVSNFRLDSITNKAQMVDTGTSSYTGAAYGNAPLIPIAKAFKQHPQDPNYYYARFHVSLATTHILSSSDGFNAIAYGVQDGESWGYNAGTAINNLSSIDLISNPYGADTSSSVIHTCKDNPVTIQIALPYLPSQVDSIVWSAPVNSNINLSGTSATGPIMVDPNNPAKNYADTSGTIVVDGQTFYIYTCPVQYQFSDYGFYPMVATAHGTFESDCAGIDKHKIYVQVSSDNIDFTAVSAGCGSTNVTFTDNTTPMAGTYITKWDWDLGDGTKYSTIDSLKKNPIPNPHNYSGLNAYWVKLQTINSVGCFSRDSVYFDLAFGIAAKFGIDRDTLCPGSTVTFSDSSSSNAATWKWDFGESGSTSTLQNPTHTYTIPGMHIISLQVFTSGNCPSKLFYDTIYVSALPKPNFTFGGVCLPGSTQFTNTSDTATGFKPYTYLWNFGDPNATVTAPNISTAVNGVHEFQLPIQTAGYLVSLIATNRFGCVDSVKKQVTTVYPKPTADFTVVKSDICLGDVANFKDNNNSTATNQTITEWNWAFGDGNTIKTTTNISNNKYTAVGIYNVKLVVVTDKGCVSDSSVAHMVKVNAIPTAAFVVPGSCLAPGATTFTDQSSITPDDGTNTPFTYSWIYAPGAPGTTKDGTYTYSNVGTYNVTQTVTSKHGCTNSITQPFVIAGSKPRPYFYVNHKDSLCNGLAVTITDTSRIDIGTIGKVEVQWDLIGDPTNVETITNPGNGKPGVSTNYTHTYPAGTYVIKLTAYAGTTAGCDESVTLVTPITVYPQPTPGFSIPSSCITGGAAVFTDLSTITPDDGTNKPFTYNWVYAPLPAPTGNTANGSYQYTAVGSYNVTQTVTSQHGCTATLSQLFDVAGSEPRPLYSVKNLNNLCSNLPVTLMDSSRLTVGVIKKVEIYWDYQGQSVPDITDNSPSNGLVNSGKSYSYTYPLLGADKPYAIKIVVYSGATCLHDTTINITVHGSPKLFATSMPDICLNALPITINEASDINGLPGTFTYSCPMAPLAIVGGNTFDPTKSNGPITDTIIAIYTTTLGGCADTTKLPIRILGLPVARPIASYPLCEKRAITFSDTSNAMGGTIDSIKWIINGNLVYGSPYTYYYPATVNDIVKLVVKTTIGCSSDTARLGLFINPIPNVDFKFDTSVCLPKGTTQFMDLTTLPGTVQPVFTYNWDFGTGSGTNPRYAFVANPTHDFTTVGDYDIKLKVTSSAGCDSSLTKTLLSTQIHPAPIESHTITPAKAQVCLGDSILFADNSAGIVKKSIWYFGDNNTDTAYSMFHTYATATSYTAIHAIIDEHNCISVNNPPIKVSIDALPIVDAGYAKYVVIGDSVVLNEVTVVAANFTSWWTSSPYNPYLNDTTVLNPVFKPTDAGIFSDTLHVRTQAGCTSTSVIQLVSLNPPVIPNAFSPNGDGVNDRWVIGFLAKYPGATVKVFNRYGQLIYNVIGYAVPWDGTVNGSPLPIGTYYYIISPKNGLKDIIGSITIIR